MQFKFVDPQAASSWGLGRKNPPLQGIAAAIPVFVLGSSLFVGRFAVFHLQSSTEKPSYFGYWRPSAEESAQQKASRASGTPAFGVEQRERQAPATCGGTGGEQSTKSGIRGRRVENSADLNGSWELVYFKPFYVCGVVTYIETSQNFTTDLKFPVRDWGCTIGCVKRRSDAVRIRVLSCNERPDTVVSTISLSGMRFRACSEDSQYTVKGTDANRWITISLHPDISCLRNRASGSCKRIIDYEREDSLNVLKDMFFARMISIGLKKSKWKTLSKNQANLQLPSALVYWIIVHGMISLFL
uniref:Uncharacterized protein n=1 Tax=Anopheles atroparvus TaxID=41427 RepID=A0A182IMV5_ANOAO